MPEPNDSRDEDETQDHLPRIPWWLWPHVLSLEAPVVAVLWQAVMARTHRVAMLPATVAGLALATWLAYVIDRLFDGANAAPPPSDARHAFYHRHRRVIAGVCVPAAAAAAAWMALWQIPQGLMWHGVAIALLVFMYVASYPARTNHRQVAGAGGVVGFIVFATIFLLPMPPGTRLQMGTVGVFMMIAGFSRRPETAGRGSLPKELAGSLLFALGCSASVQFYSMSEGVGAMSLDIGLLWVVFGMNMCGISCAEAGAGIRDPDSAASTWPLLPKLYPWLLVACIAGCASVMLKAGDFPAKAGWSAAVAGAALLLLALVWAARAKLSPLSYRVLADLALVLPAAAALA
ncbi:MAG: hypothetical protein K1X78_27965 [Verrucomicrobiaceae bacterium]|nr:hypothetical protein [Verrucomicrobiaceae bacterium]